MDRYSLGRVPAIAAAPGRVAEIGADISRLAGGPADVLLVADPGLSALGITDRVAAGLAAAGHRLARFEDIVSDPKEAQVAEGARSARGADVVVGLGGGSALDAAKTIAALADSEDRVETFRLAASPLPARHARLVCLPTTAGTGSETTAVSVLSAKDGTKFWYWGDPLKPDFVILDAELTTGLPAHLTAATGLDALVHAIEAATNRNASAANDVHALEAIRLAVRHLPVAVAEPGNIEARQGMLTAAAFAGMAIDNAGTALAHNIGHALGSLAAIHHGRAVAIAMAATLPWVIAGNRPAFARVAEAFGLDSPDALPGRFSGLLDDLGIDRTISSAIDAATLAARMAAPENAAMRRATSRDVSDADLEPLAAAILSAAGRPSEAA